MSEKILKNKSINKEPGSLTGNSIHTPAQRKGSFFKTLLKGYIDAYTTPNIFRAMLEACLILVVIVGVIILSYTGRIDAMTTSVLIAFILGFLFGKIK